MNPALNILLTLGGTAAVSSGLEKVVGSVSALAPACFSASGAIASLNQGLDAGDHFANLKARTGQAVRDLVVLDRVFETTGIGASNTAPMIGLLQRSLSGLNEEGKSTQEVWSRLKISPEALRTQSTIDQVHGLTEAFAKIEDPVERTALVMKLFGRNGAQMLQLLGDREAIKGAERDVSRLADTLERDAEIFDAVGDRISLMKSRLLEFSVVAAEKALPILTKVADVIQAINPAAAVSAMGTFLGIFATVKATAFVRKLDDVVLNWATTQSAPIGQTFAGKFLAPMTGALARVLPIGLAAAVAEQVLMGIYSAYSDWKNGRVQSASDTNARVNSFQTSSSNVHSEADRDRLISNGQRLLDEIQSKLAEAKDHWWFNQSETEIRSYQTQITLVEGQLRMLNSVWADQRIQLNAAKDSLQKQKEYVEWMRSEESIKLRTKIAENVEDQRSDQEKLANAQANVAIQTNLVHLGEKMKENEATRLPGTKTWLSALASQYEWLKRVHEITSRIHDVELRRKVSLLDERRTAIESDFLKTAEEKETTRLQLLRDENSVYADRISLLNQQLQEKGGQDPQLEGQIDGYRSKIQANQGELNAPRLGSFSDQINSRTTQMQDGIGSIAQQTGKLWGDTAESMRTSMGGAISDVLKGTRNLGDAGLAAAGLVRDAFINSSAQMAADWLMKHVVMANVKRLFAASSVATQSAQTGAEVSIHAAGEGAKTGATAGGSIVRKGIHLGETIFHGIQVVLRTGAHIAGEVLKTGVTIAQSGIRILTIIAESIGYVFQAGAGALAAMSSIPYVGPVLAIGAMAAIIGAGMSLVKNIGHADGGIISGRGTGTSDSIPALLSDGEGVIPAHRVRQYGTGFIQDIIDGKAAGPSSRRDGYVSTSTSIAQAAAGELSVTVLNVTDESYGLAALRSRPGRKIVNRMSIDNRSENGIPT